MIIIVTGSVCTGKTTHAKRLVREKKKKGMKYKYIDVTKLILSNKKKVGANFNRKFKTYDVDTDKLNKLLTEQIEEAKKQKISLVIDSHLSHYLPARFVDLCIVTRCSDLKKLKNRLKRRGYSKQKIEDNMEAEIMESCLQDAIAMGHKVKIV
ncbi:AAA family ATPase, partial [Candidatus Woesearchaeota archaeon]|nr:AAA family ATPase [Candidatus Woesearchaeota archaeon]